LADATLEYGSRRAPFPGSCVDRDLGNQEKALEFMLFDLSACLLDDSQPPVPPIVP